MRGTSQLLLPGLFDIPLSQCDPDVLANEMPQLNHLLRYASLRPNRAHSIDAMLGRVLAASDDIDASRCLPLAAAMSADESLPTTHLMLIKAVNLQAGLHNALIVPIPESQENTDQINNIFNDLRDLFKVDCDINAVADNLYLMRLKEFEAPTHYPHLLSVLGKPANPYITQSRDNLRWYRLLNEMQMFMHQHEVNQQRLAQGQAAINSLWCWGAGELPATPGAPQLWLSNDDLMRQFAARLGIDHGAARELEAAPDDVDLVLIDLRLLEALKCAEHGSLEDLLRQIDSQLIGPLLRRLGQRGAGLRLCAGSEHDYEIGARARLRFWRRPQTLADRLQRAEDS